MSLKNLMIYGETHYRQNYLNQLLMGEISLKKPDELRIVMIDPSMDSLVEFDGLPHLILPICDEGHSSDALKWLYGEVRRRIDEKFSSPSILVIVDRWLPKNDIELVGCLEEMIVESEVSGIYFWISLDDPEIIPEEFRAKIDSIYAEQGSFEFDNDIYDKTADFTSNLKQKYPDFAK